MRTICRKLVEELTRTTELNGPPPPRPGQPAPLASPDGTPAPVPSTPADLLTVPIWPLGSRLDVHVALGADASDARALPKRSFLGIRFGDWDWQEQWDVTFPVPSVRRSYFDEGRSG